MPFIKHAQHMEIPHLYETEGIPAKEKTIFLHFFFGDSHWYAAEFDQEDICFGYAIINGDLQNAEWGYFSLEELAAIAIGCLRVEIDTNWIIRPADEVDLIRLSNGLL